MTRSSISNQVKLHNNTKNAVVGGRVEQVPISAPLEEMKSVYARDGVICLTEAFSEETVSSLRSELDSLMNSTEIEHFINEEMRDTLGVTTKRRSEILAQAPDLMGKVLAEPRMMALWTPSSETTAPLC